MEADNQQQDSTAVAIGRELRAAREGRGLSIGEVADRLKLSVKQLNAIESGDFASLPGATRVYCTHEYTLANLRFALAVEPDNQALQQRQREAAALRERDLPTLPSTLSLELATNPFLRANEPAVRKSCAEHAGSAPTTAETAFAALRVWKDNFR